MSDPENKQRSAGLKIIEQILKEMLAEDILVPRSQVEMINVQSSFEEILETITRGGHSRFPVYEDKVDNIIGILYAKSFLPLFQDENSRKKFVIQDYLKKALIISENKRLNELLSEFIKSRIHMAIVVDEYGSMLGIVTLEDILEEIFGEIIDEFDQEEAVNYVTLSRKESIIKPSMSIDEFNRVFNTRIKSDDFETIGGFIIDRFGYVPHKGETIEYNHYRFEILNVTGSRIQKIKVTRE